MKPGRAVDDEDLAMIAEVDLEPATEGSDRQELSRLAADGEERIEHSPRRMVRADRVVEDANLDAGLRLVGEGRDQAPAQLVVVEDVGFDVDVALRRGDRLEDGGEGRVPLAEEVDAIALRHLRGVEALGEFGETFAERLGSGRLGARFAGDRRGCAFASLVAGSRCRGMR